MTRVRRNASCPCGSGEKYKRCCALKGKDKFTLNLTLGRKQFRILVGIVSISLIVLLIILLIRPHPKSSVGSSSSSVSPAAGLGASGTTGTTYTEIPGVELASLTAEQRSQILQSANTKLCTCGCGYTIAGCRHMDTSCRTSLPLAQAIVQAVTSANAP